jgi:hypothetical protein
MAEDDDTKLPDEKKTDIPTATGGAGNKNPYEAYADQADSGQFGPLLKFNKGEYVYGRDNEEFPEKEVVALMPGLTHGWIRWEENFPTEPIMGLMMEGFVLPARNTLGHLDKTAWELGNGNQPRDPWQESFYLPVITVNAEDVYTFTTSSNGGRRHAITPLCKEYGTHIRELPDELPVIPLNQGFYQHADPRVGKVKYPLFTPVVRWVKAEPYLAAVMALTGKTLKLLPKAS